MNNNLPEKYKESFFDKIKRFFKIGKKAMPKEDIKVDSPVNNFVDEMKDTMSQNTTSRQIDYSNKSFLHNLAKHPEALEKFSIEKLEIILNAYIAENNKSKA